MDSPVLPMDLFDEIVHNMDTTSTDGRQAVSALARTNRAFIHLCQKRLFHSVEITYIQSKFVPNQHSNTTSPLSESHYLFRDGDGEASDGEPTTGRRFCNLLLTSPHIAGYVSILTVRVATYRGFMATYGPPSSRTPTSAMDSFSLYTTIPLLSNLKSFEAYSDSQIAWSAMEDRMKGFLGSVIPKYSRVGLWLFLSVPADLFKDCPCLEDLSVRMLDPALSAPTTGTAHHTPPQGKSKLRVLQVRDWKLPWPTAHEYPSLSLSHPGIRSCTISNMVEGNRLEAFLDLCASTLEHLDIYLWPQLAAPNLASLQRLRRLTLRLRVVGPELKPSLTTPPFPGVLNPFPGPLSALRSLPHNYPMQCVSSSASASSSSSSHTIHSPDRLQLHLTIYINVCCLPNFDDSLPRLPAWSELVDYLNEDTAIRFLGQTRLVIQRTEQYGFYGTNPSPPMSLEELTGVLDKNADFEKLRERGRLLYDSA